jgi:cobalt-zinc-cadmium efflux system outer membrane protein
LFVVVVLTASASSAMAEQISLDEALRRAEKQNSDVLAASADVEQADGAVVGSGTITFNPELGLELGPEFGEGDKFFGYEISLLQTFELGGKRAKRVAGAKARRAAAGAGFSWTRQLVALRVRRAYFLAIVAREQLETAQEGEAVAAELKAAADERLRLGAGTQLEVNTASGIVGRARADRLTAERRYRETRAELAAAIGAPAEADLEPEGEQPSFIDVAMSEDAFVALALRARGDLVVLRQERLAAESDLALADAFAVPDLGVGLVYGHAGVENADTILLGVSIGLPFWNRNQGGRKVARAAVKRAVVVDDAGRREAERAARTAYRNYNLAREAVLAFDRDVVEKLGENLDMARESFRSGKIGLLEFNIVRRDLVETRRAYLDALAELIEARYALELTAGGTVE